MAKVEKVENAESKDQKVEKSVKKGKKSSYSKKKKINNGVWLLVLSAFVIALLALLKSKGYFG